MEIKEGLCFYDSYLVGVCVESVDVQFVLSGLEVDVAERFEAGDGGFGKGYKYASIACEALQVDVALAVKVRAHLLDLKIGHVAKASAYSALVVSSSFEAEAFNEAFFGQHLAGVTYEFGET